MMTPVHLVLPWLPLPAGHAHDREVFAIRAVPVRPGTALARPWRGYPFVEFAVLAEEPGFDGITVTEHHAPLMTCPSPHLLLAAAAMRTSRSRLGTVVTVLPLYSPVRVAEEAGLLDLLSGGRFEIVGAL